jgi:hypothetical protein
MQFLKTEVNVSTLCTVISKKNLVFVGVLKATGEKNRIRTSSGADPDPLENITDPEHCSRRFSGRRQFPNQPWLCVRKLILTLRQNIKFFVLGSVLGIRDFCPCSRIRIFPSRTQGQRDSSDPGYRSASINLSTIFKPKKLFLHSR